MPTVEEPSSAEQSIIPFWKQKRFIILGLSVLAVAVVSASFFWMMERQPRFLPKVAYASSYTLAPDTISESAAIVLTLPEGAERGAAKSKLQFTPEIKGAWSDGAQAEQLIFTPAKKLKRGKYYTVTLAMDNGTIGKDFLVVEDPEVTGVFPRPNSETHEDSNITVVFNRPMVPLTALQALDTKQIPVEITPPTKGTFKWIGTHTVQFIPEERLIRSSRYTVKVASDVVSVDGLKPKAMADAFTTRNLRYGYIADYPSGIVYREPVRIQFNQPVNLDATRARMHLRDNTDNREKDFTAVFGTRSVWNEASRRYDTVPDESVLLVYNKEDRNQRQKFWDVTHAYTFTIDGAVPAEGDIELQEKREIQFSATNVIANIEARSPRSSQVSMDLFDPQGSLSISFYEDIDLKKSDIAADKLTQMRYGEKCVDESLEGYDKDCVKEPNKKELIVSFDASRAGKGETLRVKLKRIVNTDGITINAAPIEHALRAFADLKILRTKPQENGVGPVDDLAICTNNPLLVPAKEDIKNIIAASPEYEFKRWNPSTLIGDSPHAICDRGTFETHITYGLIPDTSYQLQLALTDEFSQQTNLSRSFKSGPLPDYYVNFHHLQNRSVVTTPKNTVLNYAAENMEYVNMAICSLSSESMLLALENPAPITEAPSEMGRCKTQTYHTIQLPKKYWVKNYFTVDLKQFVREPYGHYILTFYHPQYRSQFQKDGAPVYDRTYLTVTNLSVAEKRIELFENADTLPQDQLGDAKKDLRNLYWVTNLETLSPVPDAAVRLYSGGGNYSTRVPVKQAETTTNAEGIAAIAPVNDIRGVIVEKGADSAVIQAQSKFNWASGATLAQKLYLYTDRPIYRPGDEVGIKGLHRIGYDGNYEIFREKKMPVKVYDSARKEILSAELDVSEFGTFSTKAALPPGAPLGTYSIEADDGRGYGTFAVEEYTPAAFEVKTAADKEEYIAGDTMKLSVNAAYYFGAPVDAGTVEYTLVSQNYYFDKYRDEYFQFGRGWYDCYDSCYYGDKFILRNSLPLDAAGKAVISERLDFKTFFPKEEDRGSKIFVLYVTVKNAAGQSVSASKSVIAHGGEYYVGLSASQYFAAKNQPLTMRLKTVDTAGKPRGAEAITLRYARIRYAYNKRREVDGGYYYTWERQRDEVRRISISTDRNGNAEDQFMPDKEGEYEVTAAGRDSRGNTIQSSYIVYVYGEGVADVRPTNDTTLELVAEKSSVAAGGTASFIIKSPYDRAKALVSIERGRIFSYEIVDITENLHRYSFPVTEDFIPNVYASVILLSDTPEVKYGQTSFSVDTGRKALDITVRSGKEQYLPGEEVELTFEAKDSFGKPVEAEFSAAVVDMSVLALKGNPKKNPVLFFYDGFPLTVSTFSNVKNILYKVDVPSGTKGGDGGDAGDLARRKRGVFKDTALWEAHIKTNAKGVAVLQFRLPDNITTWQAEAVGITKDTSVGAGYDEFVARKPLMAVPLKPRFVIPGDEFSIGATVVNQTGRKQTVRVSLTEVTFEILEKDGEAEVSVPANESKTVYFRAKAPFEMDRGEHQFTVAATAKGFEDTVTQRFAIVRNETYETTATAGYTTEAVAAESVYIPDNVVSDRGGLTVKTSATLAVFVSEALRALLEFPYGSGEQIASKLQAIAIMKDAKGLKHLGEKIGVNDVILNGRTYSLDQAAEIGLANLYRYQAEDGGFRYYLSSQYNYDYGYQAPSSVCLSAHVATVLARLEQAGYAVDASVKARLAGYLQGQMLNPPYGVKLSNDTAVAVASALAELSGSTALPAPIVARMNTIADDKTYLGDHASNASLALLSSLLNRREFSKRSANRIFDLLDNRLEIDARGSYLGVGPSLFWEYYETPVRNTALYLKALSDRKEQNEVTDGILRWLIASRAKDGSWGSTQNSLSVIDAMTQYLAFTRETESDFTLETKLNSETKQLVRYATSTVLSEHVLIEPMAGLKRQALNRLEFYKTNHNKLPNTLYYDAAFRYYLPIAAIPPRDEGFAITRSMYRQDDREFEHPITGGRVGEVLRVRGEVIVPRSRNFVAIEDWIPAGAEIVNLNLATEDQSVDIAYQTEQERQQNEWRWYEPKAARPLSPAVQEIRDDRIYMAAEHLEPGTYTYEYYIRLLIPGTYHHLPAVISENYFPENFGRTAGGIFTVER